MSRGRPRADITDIRNITSLHPNPTMNQQQQQPTPSGAGAQAINGPRSKCDQVVYEAIAKSCEIVVRGRCDIPSSTSSNNSSNSNDHTARYAGTAASSGLASGAVIVGSDRPVHGIYSPQRGFHKQFSANAGLGGGGGGGGGSNGSRFNLEVEEVSGVRCVSCRLFQQMAVYQDI